MIKKWENSPLFEEIELFLKEEDVKIVDVRETKGIKSVNVDLVLFKDSGLSLEECAKIHRNLMPRLEILLNSKDVYLEVSSPGLERVFKTDRDFIIFIDKKVKVLIGNDWVEGIIKSYEEGVITLKQEQENLKINFSDVVKAKLVFNFKEN